MATGNGIATVTAGPFILNAWASGEYFTTRNRIILKKANLLTGWSLRLFLNPPRKAPDGNGEAQVHLWPSEFKADYDSS